MMHIATTSPGYVSLYEHARRFFGRLIAARYAAAQRRLAQGTHKSLAELDDRILDDIGVSRSARDGARNDRFAMNDAMASRNSVAAMERLAGRH